MDVAIIAAGAIALATALSGSFVTWLQQRTRDAITKNLREEAAADRAELEASGASPAEAVVISNAILFKQYHSRSLIQSQLSFYFSLTAAVVGFGVIVLALWTVGRKGADDAGVAAVQLTAAVIIEAVAALFFRLSNQSRELLVSFFDKLRQDRQFEEGMIMAREVPEGDPVAGRLKSAIALHLIGAVPEQLEPVLRGQSGVTAETPAQPSPSGSDLADVASPQT
ncbi:TRADD-N-associated membrane domain-containing protein [Nocardia salmonicida]|uniref:TRADD-N-associated membrane domain-containing protein n=1 Tax=Nocardia salmonicida TaxID=53431 RepID=UPI003449FE26